MCNCIQSNSFRTSMHSWIAIASFCLVFVHGRVPTLTDSTFDSIIVEHEFALIHFFTPGWGPCEKLAPQFDIAADVLLNDKPSVFLAEVDCARRGKETCDSYQVSNHPTLKLFKQGKQPLNYEGPQNAADDIVKYVRSLVRPLSFELFSVDDVESFRDHPEHCVVGFFKEKDSVIFERYQFFASTLNDRYRFGHTFDIDVRNAYGFNNTFFIFRSQRLKTTFEADQLEYHGVYSPYKMRDWVLANIHGLVGHRTLENAVDFHYPLVVIYYDVDFVKNAKGSNYWRNRAMKVAKKFQDAGRLLKFAVSNAKVFRHELSELGLTPEAGVDRPIVVGRDDTGRKFVMDSQFTTEDLEQFTEDLLGGSLKPFVKPDSMDTNITPTNEQRERPTTQNTASTGFRKEQKTEL